MNVGTMDSLQSFQSFRTGAPTLLVPPPMVLATHRAGLRRLSSEVLAPSQDAAQHEISKLELEYYEIQQSRDMGTHSPLLIAIAVAGLALALFSFAFIPVFPLPFMLLFSAGIAVYGMTSSYVVTRRDLPLAMRQEQINEEIKKLRKKKPIDEISLSY